MPVLHSQQVEELEARIAELLEAAASSSTAAEEAAAEREQLQQQVRQQPAHLHTACAAHSNQQHLTKHST